MSLYDLGRNARVVQQAPKIEIIQIRFNSVKSYAASRLVNVNINHRVGRKGLQKIKILER